MKHVASPIARFFTSCTLTRPGYRFGEAHRTPEQIRAAQRSAARHAYLDDLSPGDRALAQLNFGDTQ